MFRQNIWSKHVTVVLCEDKWNFANRILFIDLFFLFQEITKLLRTIIFVQTISYRKLTHNDAAS